MKQSFVTVAIPFDVNRRAVVNAFLQTLGNPAAGRARALLDPKKLVHFMSITALPAAEGEKTTQIVIEFSADGEARPALKTVCEVMRGDLVTVLEKAGVALGNVSLDKFLYRHRIDVGQGWGSQPGLNFSGTPGMTVERILNEAKLAGRVAKLLDDFKRKGSALTTLECVRAILWKDDATKWAFIPEPAPMLEPSPPASAGLLAALGSSIAAFLWPFPLLAALPLLVFLTIGVLSLVRFAPAPWLSPLVTAVSLGSALWAGVVILAAEMGAGAAVYRRLRARERTDIADDIPPVKTDVDAILACESYTFQNHLAAQSRMKPGALRHFTLRVGLWAAVVIARYFSRPGFLGPTGVIHFARWVLLPGTDKLLFMSNYDGAWESYLENFIQESHQGVTGIWSNTQGFPKTSNLFFEGATDGDRLRRWTRRQQHPTLFWYSAYPELTLARIRLNAAISQGIALAATESAAADWLSCFGSEPRPADEIEEDEIPTLVFGGLRRLRYGKCLVLRLPKNNVAGCREWLQKIAKELSYGDRREADSALLVGYSQSGLRKLGLTDTQILTFPVAFQDGMFEPWRARALGDTGVNDPKKWRWGGPGCQIDAIMLAYAREEAELARLVDRQRDEARGFDIEIKRKLSFSPVPEGKAPMREAFGFIDGISQPVLRGAGRWTAPKYRDQLLAPGEILLGYRDNSGHLPPSPTVSGSDDPLDLLPGPDPTPDRQRPDFSVPQPTGQRDLGRNGTFLVIRQLEQNAPAFCAFLEEAAHELDRDKEWIAAKMVGRWRRDGTSLVRHPERPASDDLEPAGTGRSAEPDNAFRFAAEDATGRRCPFGAHVRRANPRDTFSADPETALTIANRHRILRVGRSYSPQNKAENSGLLFMCLNADIERQFEFIQQTWVLGPNFQGLEWELDPIVGGKQGNALFTIPTPEGPLRLKGIKDFVTVRGGGYFFLPGRSAVRFLSHPIL
jgi:Dyp-type peroxidase family